MTRPRTLSLVALSLLAAPLALAFRSGYSPVDRSLNIIGQLFNIQALQNQAVAVGVARFLFFILIYAILNLAGRKTIFKGDDGLSKRTSNIVAAVIAGLSAFFVPADVILTNAAGYASIVWILLAAVPGIGAMWYAFGKRTEERSRFNHAIDLLILLLGLAWSWFMLETLVKWLVTSFPNTGSVVEETLSWVILFMTIAVFVKLFQLLFGGGGDGSGWNWPWKGSGGGSGKDTKTKKGDDSTVSPEDKKKIEDAEKNGQKGLDVANPGGVRVIAKDESGTPIAGVRIHIYPKGYKREMFRKKDPRMMHIRGVTNENGIWPHDNGYAAIGSGVVIVEAELYGWYNVTWFNRGAYMQSTQTIIEPDDEKTIPLAFRRKGAKPDFFAPLIRSVKKSGKNLQMEGVVNTPDYILKK